MTSTGRAVLAALLCAFAAARGAGVGEPEARATARVLVRVDTAAAARAVVDALPRLGAQVAEIATPTPLRIVVRADSGLPFDARRIAAALATMGQVAYAVPEVFVPMELRGGYEPDDPLFASQWPLANTGQAANGQRGADVRASAAWLYSRGSTAIVIAVLDDGVQLDHPDLAPNLAGAGRDFTVEPPVDGAQAHGSADRHGTAVAGIAAARGDNGIGITGICPRCKILPIRVHGASNLSTAAAFRWAVEQGADVITNSWGYTRPEPTAADAAVRDAIDTAARDGRHGRGAIVVFGVTNRAVDNCGEHPDISSLDSVISVGVSNHNDEVGGSGFGACLDLVAPSKPDDRDTIGVPTTDRTGVDGYADGDYFAGFGGTSAAAPLVAGIAALLLSLNPELSGMDVRRILERTADKVDAANAAYDENGFSARAGYGRVNAGRALVPAANVHVVPARVVAGEPFSITVSASAPFGLESAAWRGRATGVDALDAPHERAIAGDAVASVTWSGLTIDRPGTYDLEVQTCGRSSPHAPAGYPRCATDAAPAPTARLTVLERADGLSR